MKSEQKVNDHACRFFFGTFHLTRFETRSTRHCLCAAHQSFFFLRTGGVLLSVSEPCDDARYLVLLVSVTAQLAHSRWWRSEEESMEAWSYLPAVLKRSAGTWFSPLGTAGLRCGPPGCTTLKSCWAAFIAALGCGLDKPAIAYPCAF